MTEPRDVEPSDTLDYLERAGRVQPTKKRAPSPGVSEPSAPSAQQGGLGLAVFAARAFLAELQKVDPTGSGARLSDTGRQIGMSGEVLIPLARQLETLGLLKTLEADTFGDNLVTLTDHGREVLQSPDSTMDLAKLLSPSP
jgi:hypothetical protein